MYNALKPIGSLPPSKLKYGNDYAKRIIARHSKHLGPGFENLKQIEQGKWSVVHPRVSNMDKTTTSWDCNRPQLCFSEQHKDFLDLGKMVLKREYGQLFKDGKMTPEEVFAKIDTDRSGGWPWSYMGLRTKGQVFESDIWKDLFPQCLGKDTVPIWTTSGKIEPKEITDIDNGKIRIFQIPPVHLLYWQLLFGKRIAERMKMHHWSYYGFNPYSGGFHKLALKLLQKPYRLAYDVSGWDKFIPLMKTIYEIMYKDVENSCSTEEEREMWKWVVDNTIEFLLKMPNGDVVLKKFGNASGSGMTTRDNILCHIILFAFILSKAYYNKMGKIPSIELISSQIAAIFGDDCIASVDEEFSYMTDFAFLKEQFWLFGLELKFLEVSTTNDLSNLSFLGAHFVQRYGYYLPEYDPTRLAFSMLYGETQPTLEEYAQKILTLTIMSYASKHYEVFKKATEHFFNTVKPVTDIMKSCAALIPLDDAIILSFFTGGEGPGPPPFMKMCMDNLSEEMLADEFCTTSESMSRLFRFFKSNTIAQCQSRMVGGTNHRFVFKEKVKMMQRVSHGEKILEELVKNSRSSLTETGKNAVLANIDPFHDTPIEPLTGWPDMNNGQSIVRCVKVGKSVSATSGGGVAPTTPWDMHITLWPWLYPQAFIDVDNRMNNVGQYDAGKDGGGNTIEVGGLQVTRVVTPGAAAEFFPAVGTGNNLAMITPDPVFLRGIHRVIGIGWELYDTTAELYKQGDVTVYQQNQAPKDGSNFSLTNTTSTFAPDVVLPNYNVTGTMYSSPPQTTDNALLLAGSKSWKAADGVYQVARFHSSQNEPFAADYNVPIVFSDPANADRVDAPQTSSLFVAAPGSRKDYSMALGAATLIKRDYIPAAQHLYPYHQCGAIFSGLSPQASFKICMNIFIETFPGIDESTLLPSTKPSAAYDPMAIEIINHCMSKSPVAVPVRQNGLGEWFVGAITSAADFVAPLLMKSGDPRAMAVGGALQVASSFAKPRKYQATQGLIAPGPGMQKRKRVKKKNDALLEGHRGKRGRVQGPMLPNRFDNPKAAAKYARAVAKKNK